LSGIAAASVSQTGTLGYIAGFPFPEVIRGINAFALGAQSVNPDVTVEVVWTNSDGDAAVENNAANVLIEAGADVLAAQQDSAATGEFAASNGVRWIGYGMNLSDAAPSAFLTATTWHWTGRYVQVINLVATGDYEPVSYWGGLADGVVALADLKGVSDELRGEIADERQRVEKGDLKIFEGPIVDQAGTERVADGNELSDDELRTMDWFVAGVIGSPRR
ncbi:MAG: BMP family ABC transporter substrate-binding protein, partial [Acidimicrobiales bacterium]